MRKFWNKIGFTALMGALCIGFSGCGDCNATVPPVYSEIRNLDEISASKSCEEIADDLSDYYEENKEALEEAFKSYTNDEYENMGTFDLTCYWDSTGVSQTVMVQFYFLNVKLDKCLEKHQNSQQAKMKRLITTIKALYKLVGWAKALRDAILAFKIANTPPTGGGGGGDD